MGSQCEIPSQLYCSTSILTVHQHQKLNTQDYRANTKTLKKHTSPRSQQHEYSIYIDGLHPPYRSRPKRSITSCLTISSLISDTPEVSTTSPTSAGYKLPTPGFSTGSTSSRNKCLLSCCSIRTFSCQKLLPKTRR